MNDTFIFSRFFRYLGYDLKKAFSRYGYATLLLALFPVILVLFVNLFAVIFKGSEYQWITIPEYAKILTSIFAVGFFMISMPVSIYGNLTDKRSGSDWLLVPASRLEKYVSMLIVVLIVLPVITVGGYLLSDWIVTLLDKGTSLIACYRDSVTLSTNDGFVTINSFGVFWWMMMSLFSGILTFFLGGIFFKKNKVAKTIFCLIALSIVSSVFLSISVVHGLDNMDIDEEWMFEKFQNGGFAINALLHTLSDLPVIIFLVLIWFRLKALKH